jgi:hypothetical protein
LLTFLVESVCQPTTGSLDLLDCLATKPPAEDGAGSALMNFHYPKSKLFVGLSGIAVVIVLSLWYLEIRGINILPIANEVSTTQGNGGASRTYVANLVLSENPISENGNWVNGKAVGIDWANVATTPGLAYGTESGRDGYDDSVALLTGTLGSDQMAEATVHSINQSDNSYEEVELHLRSSLSAHRATGYEINFRCLKTAYGYTQIVRWEGPLGKFKYLASQEGAKYGVADGDVVRATIVGNEITAYINGVRVLRARDNTYATGNPGMGFFLQGGSGVNQDYGFSSFKASDRL